LKVSVVIPTRDRLTLLKDAVHSVMTQSLSEWELIVVDDASSDGTEEWLARLTDARISVIRLPEHSERSRALNAGLNAAEGGFVIFLDDDDRLAPGALMVMKDTLLEAPEAVGVVGAMRFFDPSGQTRKMPHPRGRHVSLIWPEILAGFDIGRGQMLVRTETARAVGGWGSTDFISDDIEFALNNCRAGPTIVISDVVVHKRIHAGNTELPAYWRRDREIRRGFVATLEGEDRARGARALAFFDLWMRAHDLYHVENDYRRALSAYVKAIRAAPEIARSPVIRARLRGRLTKSLLGSMSPSRGLASRARRAHSILRHRFGRYPDLRPTVTRRLGAQEETDDQDRSDRA
jgi:glycosyltransferase involved in cell wall biosynthesis